MPRFRFRNLNQNSRPLLWNFQGIPQFLNLRPKAISTGPRRGSKRNQWDKRKRSKVRDDDDDDELEVSQFFQNALTLQPGLSTCNLDSRHEREKLADLMWQCSDVLGDGSTTVANRKLAAVLEVILRNTYRSNNPELAARRTAFRVESILADLQRAKSQKVMPILTARFSCACLRAQLPRQLWELFSLCFPGLLASFTWTLEFVTFGSSRRPPCSYDELPGVGGVMFDNYTRKVLYASKVTVNSHGYLLNMTNWGSVRIPRMLAPANFNAAQLCKCSSCLKLLAS